MDIFLALFHNFFSHILKVIAALQRGKFYEHGEVNSGYYFYLVILNETETESGF